MASRTRIVLISIVACFFNISALAADLPARQAAVVPAEATANAPAFSWTGFYFGGELGWVRANPKYTPGAAISGAPAVASSLPVSDKNGAIYGFLAGYSYQVDQFVFGVEGDLTGWTVGEVRSAPVFGEFITAKSKWGGSIRGRFGYAVDHALLYINGGVAFASNKTYVPTTGYSIGDSGTLWGWTLGGGLDYAFTNHWFAGLEYRYTQYESKTITFPASFQNLGIVGFKQELNTNQVTVRLGYKF
jgi:outer membrane immunogenic protein